MSFEAAMARAMSAQRRAEDLHPFITVTSFGQNILRDSRRDYKQALKEALSYPAQLWDPNTKFQKYMLINGDSYEAWQKEYQLENIKPDGVNKNAPDERIDIPGTEMYYAHMVFPKEEGLQIAQGNRCGLIMFDRPVFVMMIRQHKKSYQRSDPVWMSFTPMEVFTLRAGTRKARGHTIVAGLGMGYQLIQVTRKKTVKKVTVVEISKELVDWVRPRIEAKLGDCEIDWVVGNAKDVLPTLTADVALVDIFSSYGGNWFSPPCPNIKTIWCWGAA